MQKLSSKRFMPIAYRRSGSTVAEVMVAAVLLATMVSFAATVIVRSGRIWKQTRHAQLCMDELSNQWERLISLNDARRADAIASLAPSDELKSALPDAKLVSETVEDDDGVRLILSLHWQPYPGAKPTRLVGWIDSSDSLEGAQE